jgi:hypothetical protein
MCPVKLDDPGHNCNLQALALNMRGLTTLHVHVTPVLKDGWPLLGQLPNVTSLTLGWDTSLPSQLAGSIWRALQSMQGLRKLSAEWSWRGRLDRGPSLDFSQVSSLTQLQSLNLGYLLADISIDCARLSSLAGLTSLALGTTPSLRVPVITGSDGPSGQRQRRLWQIQQHRRQQQALEQWRQHHQQLQHSLSCMQHLGALVLNENPVPAGIAHTLEGLPCLTRLVMRNLQADQQWYAAALCRPVLLPCLQLLDVSGEGALQFLAGTYAPVLREFQHLGIPLGTAIDQARVLGFTAAALQQCSSIEVTGVGQVPASQVETLLAALPHANLTKLNHLKLKRVDGPRVVMALIPVTITSLTLRCVHCQGNWGSRRGSQRTPPSVALSSSLTLFRLCNISLVFSHASMLTCGCQCSGQRVHLVCILCCMSAAIASWTLTAWYQSHGCKD